jgi:serine/threonine protein kinase
LFLEKKTLHRDVSLHNVILTDPEETSGRSGLLIDLELSVEVGDDGRNRSVEARTMTGTLEYMAIEILEGALRSKTDGTQHTYRHDLESFFYVLLSACIHYGWEDGMAPRTNPLHEWYTGRIMKIYAVKTGDMTSAAFENVVLPAFAPRFAGVKELARKLRDILFSRESLYTGTPERPEVLYTPIIQAFDEALQTLSD